MKCILLIVSIAKAFCHTLHENVILSLFVLLQKAVSLLISGWLVDYLVKFLECSSVTTQGLFDLLIYFDSTCKLINC